MDCSYGDYCMSIITIDYVAIHTSHGHTRLVFNTRKFTSLVEKNGDKNSVTDAKSHFKVLLAKSRRTNK